MPKKSHSVASGYAARSRKKKKGKGAPLLPRSPAVSLPPDITKPPPHITKDITKPPDVTKPEPSPGLSTPIKESARPSQELPQVSPEYRYLAMELKTIGVLGGAIFIVLIVLGFALR